MSTLLVTGGAGFIGSHTCLNLLEARHKLVVLDNFSNSSRESLNRVQSLAGVVGTECLSIVEGDIRSTTALNRAFSAGIDAVIHFAGLKAVSDSVVDPLKYWDVNVTGSCHLLAAMQAHRCRTIVFSSSCTVYGDARGQLIHESVPCNPVNPYGHTKAAVEEMLAHLMESEPGWRIAILRYFNPVGGHPSGKIGEDPCGIPNNLFPFISQVAVGRRQHLQVFGGDWPTHDGTCVRDYIHVMDLADGHCAALKVLLAEPPQLLTLNLGSGKGYSVMDVVSAFEKACFKPVPFTVVERRSGDASCTVADPSLAAKRLGWRAQRTLAEMCRDSWAWQSSNPSGYC